MLFCGPTYFWFEDDLIDLGDYPYEHATIDSLDEGVADIPGLVSAKRADDGFSPCQRDLGAERFLEILWGHSKEMCCILDHTLFFDEGHWKIVLLHFCMDYITTV